MAHDSRILSSSMPPALSGRVSCVEVTWRCLPLPCQVLALVLEHGRLVARLQYVKADPGSDSRCITVPIVDVKVGPRHLVTERPVLSSTYRFLHSTFAQASLQPMVGLHCQQIWKAVSNRRRGQTEASHDDIPKLRVLAVAPKPPSAQARMILDELV